MDETWLHHFQPETKQQSKPWKQLDSLPPKEAKTGMSVGKVMASIFWDADGLLLMDYVDKVTLSPPEPSLLIFRDSYGRKSSRFGVES